MNYIKIYKNLISLEDSEMYLENHHIIPKSIFKNINSHKILNMDIPSVNHKDNKVLLSGRKHFLAHKLLVKIFKNKNTDCFIKLNYAMKFLSSRIPMSGKKYEWCRKSYSKAHSEFLKGKPSRAKGCKWSEESKKSKSENNPAKGKTYVEQFGEDKAKLLKDKRREQNLGKKLSEETKQKIKDSRRFDENWRNKISKSKLGIPLSEETKQKMREYFSNPDLHPSVIQILYKFKHKDGREIICRIYDMKLNYKCNTIHRVVRDKTKSSKGWYCLGEINP